jgi:prepilin peptidase CpaA
MLFLVIPLTAVAALTDARRGIIPNWLTLPALLLALVWRLVSGGMTGAFLGLFGALACGLVPWIMHRATGGRAIGGGDIKLFAAAGALLGPGLGLELELSSFVILAMFALVQLTYRGLLVKTLWGSLRLAAGPLLPARMRTEASSETLTEMRMGPAILLAAIVVVLRDTWLPGLPWPV